MSGSCEEESMRKSYGERAAGAIVFLLLIEIYFFYNTYATIGGFGVGYQYIGCIMVIMVGGVFFLVNAEVPVLYCSVRSAGVLALPYFAAMIWSAAIWIFSFTPVRQMISGFFEPAYMVLSLFSAAILVYVFKENAALYSFWALTATLLLMVLQRITEFGLTEFFRRLLIYEVYGKKRQRRKPGRHQFFLCFCFFLHLFYFSGKIR